MTASPSLFLLAVLCPAVVLGVCLHDRPEPPVPSTLSGPPPLHFEANTAESISDLIECPDDRRPVVIGEPQFVVCAPKVPIGGDAFHSNCVPKGSLTDPNTVCK